MIFFHSDHRALYLSFQNPENLAGQNTRKRSRFRFENMWIGEPDYKEIISCSWISTDQSALLSIIDNIKQCSNNLASWDKAKFGSLARDIRETHQRIVQLHNMQGQVDNNRELKAMEEKLNDLLLKEEIFWKQRSRIEWMKAGDQNTKFFHLSAKKRNKINTIKGTDIT